MTRNIHHVTPQDYVSHETRVRAKIAAYLLSPLPQTKSCLPVDYPQNGDGDNVPTVGNPHYRINPSRQSAEQSRRGYWEYAALCRMSLFLSPCLEGKLTGWK